MKRRKDEREGEGEDESKVTLVTRSEVFVEIEFLCLGILSGMDVISILFANACFLVVMNLVCHGYVICNNISDSTISRCICNIDAYVILLLADA